MCVRECVLNWAEIPKGFGATTMGSVFFPNVSKMILRLNIKLLSA